MAMSPPIASDVLSARELAQAAGLPPGQIRHLIATGAILTIDGEFVAWAEAVRALRALGAAKDAQLPALAVRERPLFSPPAAPGRRAGMPLALSSTLHALVVAGAVLLSAVGVPTGAHTEPAFEITPARLVFLDAPGPGGGGGGGGLRQPAPPPRAERQGERAVSSPLPARQEPALPLPAPLEHEPLPPVIAPIITAPADTRDRIGVLSATNNEQDSRGPGAGGGAGSGSGTGVGEGEGPGIGPGTGGGTGGGPYRPGSGIEPPRLLREVRADYSEDARRRSLEGEVLLEIVVQSDGTVGDVRILRPLDAGLDRNAVAAVRQWRFAPARRFGMPVDVLVEVAVEFRLR